MLGNLPSILNRLFALPFTENPLNIRCAISDLVADLDGHHFTVWDTDGNVLRVSREYDKIYAASQGYILVRNGDVKLIDSYENEVAVYEGIPEETEIMAYIQNMGRTIQRADIFQPYGRREQSCILRRLQLLNR